MCLVILIPWREMSHSHPCLIFFLITSRFSLIYPPRGSLSLKEHFNLVFTITAVLFHSLLPLYCSQWLFSQGSKNSSRLSSLPIFTWAVSFPQTSPTPQAHKLLCPCFTQDLTVFLSCGCPWLSTFLLPSSAKISYRAHYIFSFLQTLSLMPSSYFCANLSLQILMPFCNYLAHLPFLVCDSIMEMWCNMM